jgi:catechol 2,3-dioxygenase-like lactoylglutathione lyase family enzyme
MNTEISLITILTNDVKRLVGFYHSALGFDVKQDMDQYVELLNPGVRFAICARSIMENATGNTGYHEPRSGQTFELAFPCESPAEVDLLFADIISKGAVSIKPPADMPWKQRTAFFADPDGNIQELFADLS